MRGAEVEEQQGSAPDARKQDVAGESESTGVRALKSSQYLVMAGYPELPGGRKAELDGRLWGTENYRILWELCQDGDRHAQKVGTARERA